MVKELNEGRGRYTGASIAAVIAVSVVMGLCVLLVVYAGLLAITPSYFLIHRFAVSKLGLFTAFADATTGIPPILLAGLLLIAAILLVMLWMYLTRKILDHCVIHGVISVEDSLRADSSLPAADEYAAPDEELWAGQEEEEPRKEEPGKDEHDDLKVDMYLKQLDAMSSEEIESFFKV